MKTKRKIDFISVLLVFVFMFCCVKTDEYRVTEITASDNSLNASGYIETDGFEIWSAPSTAKIIKEETDYDGKGEFELNYTCVKNEYESYQLGITAKTAVSSYYLTAVDLTDGNGNKISKENFTVYNELFYYFDGNSVDASPNYYADSMLKSFPDALIPIKESSEAGECGIEENNNAALWITVYIPKTTVAGVYSGSFSMTVSGQRFSLPVSVTVYDYTLTDENHAVSTFTQRNYKIGVGEMDTSVEMIEKYYESALDYRISPRTLPQEATDSVDEFIELVKKYYSRYSNFALGTSGNITLGINYDYVLSQILGLAENSTAEINLLSKAIFYAMDEPNMANEQTKYNSVFLVRKIISVLNDAADIIENDSTSKYSAFKSIAGWKDIILNIPDVVPFGSYEYVQSCINTSDELLQEYVKNITWCPCWDIYDDSTREAYLALAEEADADLWWYSCTGPAAPYGTYHIGDSNLLSARSISWMQKKYNIEGNLYWDIVGYSYDTPEKFTDIYSDPHVATSSLVAGDGNLFYPGAKYGIYGPLPSVRIMSIRDGLEEYEMLYDLENKNLDIIGKNGYTAEIDEVMSVYYSELYYSGNKLFADGEGYLDFDDLRLSLIKSVTDDSSEFMIHSITTTGSSSVIKFSIKQGCSVAVNGNSATSLGNGVYQYTLNLKEYTNISVVVKEGASIIYQNNFFIDGITTVLSAFETLPSTGIELDSATGGEYRLNTDSAYSYSGNSLAFKLVTKGLSLANRSWTPKLIVLSTAFDEAVDFGKVFTMSVSVYNAGSECDMRVYIGTSSESQQYAKVTLKSGMNKVSITVAQGTLYDKLSECDRLIFEFNNGGTADSPITYQCYLDNITVNYKQ